jgi:ABC-type nitrate/sulfonate/bicarbonate transport system substrate-binding protein
MSSLWGRRSAIQAITLALAILAMACNMTPPSSTSPAAGGSAASSTPTTLGSIVIGTGVDTTASVLLAAVRKGFFEQNGIKVANITGYQSSSVGVEGVITGQADVSYGAAATTLLAAAKGADIKMLGVIAYSGYQTGVVAVASVEKPKDLEGKKVCAQANNNAEQFFLAYVDYYKLDRSTITYRDFQSAQMPVALLQGECDVAFTKEPDLTRALQSVSGSHVLERGGDHGLNLNYSGVIVNKKIYANQELASAFVKSLVQAGDWANTHRDEMAQLLNKEYQIALPDARQLVGAFEFQFRFDSSVRQNMADTYQFSLDKKLITTPFDINTFMHDQFAKQLVPERVN